MRAGGGEESKERTQNQYISTLHTHTHSESVYKQAKHKRAHSILRHGGLVSAAGTEV